MIEINQLTNDSKSPEELVSNINKLIESIESLDTYIQKHLKYENESSNNQLDKYIIEEIIKAVKENLNNYSVKSLENVNTKLLDLHKNLISIKKNIDDNVGLPPYYAPYSMLIETIPLSNFYSDQPFRTNLNLSSSDINKYINEIISRVPTIKISSELNEKYKIADEIEKKQITSKIIRLRNEIKKPKTSISDEFIEDLANNLNLTVSSIGLGEKLRKIDNTYEILDQVNSEESVKSVKAIESGYKGEAQKLSSPICILNFVIILIFILIIIVISLKFYAYFIHTIEINYKPEGLIKFFLKIGKEPSDFIFFFSLIFSISALETYLIKERNRLIKLRDYFLFCDLELTSMPNYMRELNLDQRQNLYIDLSRNYFKGGSHDNNKDNSNNEDVSDVLKKVEELTKIIKELKN